MKSIFISKDIQDLIPELSKLVSENKLTAQSLIDFQALPFDCPTPADITFFASIRAADFYLSKCKVSPIIAVAGNETARKIKDKYQLDVTFVAEESGNPEHEAALFNHWRGDKTVVFPTSNVSLGTYMKNVPDTHKTIIQVYQTVATQARIEKHSVYVFSSPSNVLAFMQVNQFPKDAIIVAWGNSTQKALQSQGIAVQHTLLKDQQVALLAWLKTENFI